MFVRPPIPVRECTAKTSTSLLYGTRLTVARPPTPVQCKMSSAFRLTMLSDDLVQLFWRLKFDVILALREEKWDFVQWLGTRRSHLLMKQALRRWLRQALFIRIKQKAVGLLGVVLLRANFGQLRPIMA